MRKYFPLLFILFLTGCVPSSKFSGQEHMLGKWERTSLRQSNIDGESNKYTIDLSFTLNDDGTIKITEDDRTYSGHFFLEEDRLVVLNKTCDAKGVYFIELVEGKLKVEEIDDDCIFRRILFEGEWTKDGSVQ